MTEKAFSSIDIVSQCMLDLERSDKLLEALKEVISPDSKVLDVGTGTGLLALLSAKLGAKSVKAIEFDPYVAKVANDNVLKNGFKEIVEIIEGDATSFTFKEKQIFDVVVMELLTTGLIDEVQVPAINNLHEKGYVTNNTVFVPSNVLTSITLVNSDYNLYGLNMKMIRHLWKDFPNSDKSMRLSDICELTNINFSTICPEKVEKEIMFKIQENGIANGLLLESRTYLSNSVFIDDTLTLNAPVLIPIADIHVEKNQMIKFSFDYTHGAGYDRFLYKILS